MYLTEMITRFSVCKKLINQLGFSMTYFSRIKFFYYYALYCQVHYVYSEITCVALCVYFSAYAHDIECNMNFKCRFSFIVDKGSNF